MIYRQGRMLFEFVKQSMKPTRQQVVGSILLAAVVLIIFMARARHIFAR